MLHKRDTFEERILHTLMGIKEPVTAKELIEKTCNADESPWPAQRIRSIIFKLRQKGHVIYRNKPKDHEAQYQYIAAPDDPDVLKYRKGYRPKYPSKPYGPRSHRMQDPAKAEQKTLFPENTDKEPVVNRPHIVQIPKVSKITNALPKPKDQVDRLAYMLLAKGSSDIEDVAAFFEVSKSHAISLAKLLHYRYPNQFDLDVTIIVA